MTAGDRYSAKALEPLADVETNPKCDRSLKIWPPLFCGLLSKPERNTELIIEFELPPEQEGNPKSKAKL